MLLFLLTLWIHCHRIILWIRKEVVLLSSKLGKPTNDPKILNTRIRLSAADVERLEFCAEKTGLNKSDIIRIGIQKVYEELAK